MAKITLHSDNQNSATSVSNIFIDEYMSDANGEFVKIYLYLLRLMNAPDTAFSISSIADKFEHTEGDIKRALCYWERMRLLRLEYDDGQNLTGICLLGSAPREVAQPKESGDSSAAIPEGTAASGASPKPAVSQTSPETRSVTPEISRKKPNYSRDDIRRFRQEDSIAELFFIAERYLGRMLNDTDVQTILYLYDSLGFSTDLIEYLIESCVNSRHTSIRYIEKTALHWADNHITTVEEAKLADSIHDKAYYAVMRGFGISGRNLIPAEVALLKKWTTEYAFSDELIVEACQRTICSIHQPSFQYADSILTGWHKKQVRSLDELAALDTDHQTKKKNSPATTGSAAPSSKNKFNNFAQRSYDYDELEKMLLTTNVR